MVFGKQMHDGHILPYHQGLYHYSSIIEQKHVVCKVLIWDSRLTQSLVSSPSTDIQYCGYSHLAHGLANQLMVLANPLGSPCSLPVYGCLGT